MKENDDNRDGDGMTRSEASGKKSRDAAQKVPRRRFIGLFLKRVFAGAAVLTLTSEARGAYCTSNNNCSGGESNNCTKDNRNVCTLGNKNECTGLGTTNNCKQLWQPTNHCYTVLNPVNACYKQAQNNCMWGAQNKCTMNNANICQGTKTVTNVCTNSGTENLCESTGGNACKKKGARNHCLYASTNRCDLKDNSNNCTDSARNTCGPANKGVINSCKAAKSNNCTGTTTNPPKNGCYPGNTNTCTGAGSNTCTPAVPAANNAPVVYP